MPRTKGAKNKPKDNGLTGLTYETLPDLLTPEETAKWWRTSRIKIMRQIYNKEIPEDCYIRNGNRYLLIKCKLAQLKGLREPAA